MRRPNRILVGGGGLTDTRLVRTCGTGLASWRLCFENPRLHHDAYGATSDVATPGAGFVGAPGPVPDSALAVLREAVVAAQRHGDECGPFVSYDLHDDSGDRAGRSGAQIRGRA